MHKALREVLGEHVQQKGSLVDAEQDALRLRAQRAADRRRRSARSRQIVNAEILANHATQARVMPIDEAQKLGAMMLFGEKYGDEVRVLDIGSSRELCGGTHVQRTGDIGLFKIVAESGVAAGVRRVEAVTGDNALAYLQSLEGTVQRLAGALRSAPAEVPARVGQVLEHVRALEKELAALKGRLASSQGDDLRAAGGRRQGPEGARGAARRRRRQDAARHARQAQGQAEDRGHRARRGRRRARCRSPPASPPTASAGSRPASSSTSSPQQVGGKGGGKADMAMAGGTDPSRLAEALASVPGWVGERVRWHGHALSRRARGAVPGRLQRSGAGDAAIAARRGAPLLRRRCATPALADDLERTVDYRLAGDLIDAVQGREFLLIERVAETLAEVALRNPLVDHVTISVKKRPPVQGLEWAGVQITRGRARATRREGRQQHRRCRSTAASTRANAASPSSAARATMRA